MKRIAAFAIAALLALSLFSCGNKKIIDTVYTFRRAIIELPNGDIVEGEVENWRDFSDGDQIQVKINGVTYLVHSSDIALMTEIPAN